MDGLIAQIVAFSTPHDYPQLVNALKNADVIFAQNLQQLPAALQQLDARSNSLGWLHILHALGKGNIAQGNAVYIDNVVRFLSVCDPAQIQLAPDIFCAVCKRFKEHVIAAGNPRRGILPLRAALQALQPGPEVLSPVHADFFQLCLLSRCYNAAAGVLAQDIYDVAPALTSCTPTDLFLYCYYGGMLALGRKQHARALELLLQAVSAPALAGNAIVVAAYKKYVLACLIHAGQLLPLPKFTSTRVRQVLEAECRPYAELASAYASRSADKLRRVAEQHAAVFAQDTNLGLVRQVLSGLTVRSIQRLTATYLTLPLGDIATSAGLGGAGEAEGRLVRMVAAGQIHARIDGRSGMVRFAEGASASTSSGGTAAGGGAAGAGTAGGAWCGPGGVAALDERLRQVLELGGRLQKANEMVSTDRAYLSKVTARERSKYDIGGGAVALAAAAGVLGGGGGSGMGGEDSFTPFAAGPGSSGSQQM